MPKIAFTSVLQTKKRYYQPQGYNGHFIHRTNNLSVINSQTPCLFWTADSPDRGLSDKPAQLISEFHKSSLKHSLNI